MSLAATPNNFYVQQGNQQVFLNWDLSVGATSYQIQRSVDGVNFGLYATVATNSYLDTIVTVGTQYFYQVAAATTAAFQAFATMTLAGQPNPGDTFSLANVTFTAVASGATGTQFNIGVLTTNTAANIVTAVINNLPFIVTPSAVGSVITFLAYAPGLEGNGIQFSSALTNASIAPFSGGSNGQVSAYTIPQSVVPTPTAEMSLGQIRLLAQQRADRVNSQFIQTPEWNSYINQSMFELYDLLVTAFEDYFIAPPIQFQSVSQQYIYPLPDGKLVFQDTNRQPVVAPPFFKLRGVDLGLNSSNNAWVTVEKFMFLDRNRYVYPNTASTIYGVFNLQYRVMGTNIEFIPPPSGNQPIQLWYVPRLNQLLKDNDLTTIGYSGWLEYVITDAAIKALQKEESDVSVLAAQKMMLIKRIEEAAQNRDIGQPDSITDVRASGIWGTNSDGYGGGGPIGGY